MFNTTDRFGLVAIIIALGNSPDHIWPVCSGLVYDRFNLLRQA